MVYDSSAGSAAFAFLWLERNPALPGTERAGRIAFSVEAASARSKGAGGEVFPGLPEFDNGYVYANDKPGLGVDLNEEEAAKYPCENTVTTWTQTRHRDGALQTP